MMSKLLRISLLVLVATFSVSAFAQEENVKFCNGKYQIVVNDLAPNAEQTALISEYAITISPDAIPECESVIITTVVKDADSDAKKVVEVIVVNGTGVKGVNSWVSKACYKVCDPNRVKFYKMKEGESLTIKTKTQIPYETWMDDGKFKVATQQVVYTPTCIKDQCSDEICDVPYLSEPLVIDPLWVNIPMGEPRVKDPKRAIKTRIHFPVNGIASVESYFENAQALGLLATLNSPNFDVDQIKIEGWASPEATVVYNQGLSVKRANTMKKIISEKYDFPESVYTVSGNGEYWDDVLNFIATTQDATVLAAKEKLDNAIADNDNLDKREAAMKRVDAGKPYKVIFNQVYPRSRFTDCEVSYRVKNYDREEVMVIFNNDPTQVSADEYVQLLNENADAAILAKALEIYPNDDRINAIAGNAAKEAGNIDAALAYFQKAGDTPEAYNNQACCWLLKGNADKAKACLEKAKSLKVYEGNANEVRKVVLNNKYFSK